MSQHSLINCAATVILFAALSFAQPFLVPIFIAALLAFLTAPVVKKLKKFGIPDWISTSSTILLLLLPFSGIAFLLIRQIQSLIEDFPKLATSIDNALLSLADQPILKKLDLDSSLNLKSVATWLSGKAGESVQIIFSSLGAFVSASSIAVLIMVFTFLILNSRTHLRKCAELIVGKKFDPTSARHLLDEITSMIERFLVARFLIMILVGIADFGILFGFQVKYAFLLATFLGAMTAIPAIGFIISLIPAIIVSIAIGHSLLGTIFMVISLSVVSLIEGNVLTPLMVGRSLKLSALSTFLGLFAGGLLWGIGGIFLSVPILGVLKILLSFSPRYRIWGELLSGKVSSESAQNKTFKLKMNPRVHL